MRGVFLPLLYEHYLTGFEGCRCFWGSIGAAYGIESAAFWEPAIVCERNRIGTWRIFYRLV